MIGNRDVPAERVALRRQAKVAEIVDAAWFLAREHGIAGVSLHELARRVGMRQPSLYAYFDSKMALYDAMFSDGNRQLLARFDALRLPRHPRAALKKLMAEFVAFGMEDAARYELLFERHVPGFSPSEESYALAEEVLAHAHKRITEAGVTKQGDIDCMVALVAGLMAAQMSNEPSGNRWIRHLGRLIDLYLDDAIERNEAR
jgi:AcrR family transcriptional regulator